KPDGFVEVRVPDFAQIVRDVAERKLDIDDVIGVTAIGPLLVRDMIYGYHKEIERSGNDYYAHKTAFTPQSLVRFFDGHGFVNYVILAPGNFEIVGYFFKQIPSADLQRTLGIKIG